MKSKKITIAAVLVILIGSNFIPLISSKTPGMVKNDFYGITIYSMPEDRENAKIISSLIVKNRERIISFLPGSNTDEIDVIIYPSHNSLHAKTFGLIGYFFPSWYIGKNTGNRVLITSPSNPGPSHTRESIEKAAIHEYVHVLTDRINKNIGYWMKEGIALYLAEQIPNCKDVLSYSKDITFKNFSTHNPFAFANYGGYSMAYSYIQYLEQEHGWEKVIHLLDKTVTYEDVLGLSEQETFLSWQKWAEENYS